MIALAAIAAAGFVAFVAVESYRAHDLERKRREDLARLRERRR